MRQFFRIGQGGDPCVESRCQLVFTEVDGARMIAEVYRYRTGLTQLTAVEDAGRLFPDAGGALHPPSAGGAEQQPAQRIGHRRIPAADQARTPPRLCPKANSLSRIVRNQRFVRAAVRCDPVGLITPPHARLVPSGDIVRVDQHLVFLLLAPHSDAEICRVVEDGADRRMRPTTRVAVAIACRVVLAR
ncbi:hypothetical protein AWC07_22175 [Mycobacterium gastri]|uniref:Uncharacterized protein n=1 Tax=Mycobacterium gastri TaxID=1777 RepID=A0A1X1W1K2_MYCGS|nr:hypothetical protein AWC07_22175 [Mycobacterium gastri]